ncbi:MAG: biotin attachment protein [Ignavibacteriaceae bacterium]|nr:biotin attachment protein [Ignavibacteriaceae bacterium]
MNEFILSLNGKKSLLEFKSDTKVVFNGEELNFEIFELVNNVYFLRIEEKLYKFTCTHIKNENIVLYSNNEKYEFTALTRLQDKAKELLSQKKDYHHLLEIKAPMPGMILKIKKQIGDEINQGEPVLILEAMKMENEIRSPGKGILKQIFVREGNTVEKGTILFSIQN